MNTNENVKINLAEKTAEARKAYRIEKREAAKKYVNDTLIPIVVEVAEKGGDFLIVSPPSGLVMEDVIHALQEKVECYARPNGLRGRINISW